MALFKRRKQNTDVLPKEVREYYQAENRERTGVAWLLAVGTLLLTFVIAAALFFGGRWVYRTVFDKDDNKSSESSQQQGGLSIDDKGNVIGGSVPAPTDSTNSSSTPSSAPATSTAPSSSRTTQPTITPNTGPSELVNTGPGDEGSN